MPTKKRKVVILKDDDDEVEKFTRSDCMCNVCFSMNQSYDDWSFVTAMPVTRLQKKMKQTIESLEDRYGIELVNLEKEKQE